MNAHSLFYDFQGRVRGLVIVMETAYKYQNWPEIGQLIARLKQVEEELTATQHREVYGEEEQAPLKTYYWCIGCGTTWDSSNPNTCPHCQRQHGTEEVSERCQTSERPVSLQEM